MGRRPLIDHPPPRPVVYCALALLAGTAMGFRLGVAPVYPAAAALVCAGLAAWRLWRSRRIHGPLAGGGALLLAALALLGWARAAQIGARDRASRAAVAPLAQESMVLVEGPLAAEPRVNLDSERVELVLEAPAIAPLRAGAALARINLNVAVSVTGEAAAAMAGWKPALLPLPGQRVRAWGRLRTIEPPTTPNPFDPERAAAARGIAARLTVTQPGDLELGPAPAGVRAALAAALRQARTAIAQVLKDRLPSAQVPIARALVLGEAHLVPVPEREAYALTGLAHLLAVSGLNTAFVLLLVVWATRLLGFSPRGTAWVGITGVLAYAALTGFEPPVMRATVMGVFFLGGYLLRRVTSPPATLAAAAFSTLLFDPRNLTRVEWQLSYACVLSIVTLTPPIYEALARPWRRARTPGTPNDPPGWPLYLLHQLVLLPLAGLIAVHAGIFPLQVEIFRQYNLLSPIYNMICCGLSLLVMFGVIVAALLGAVPYLGAAAALPAQAGLACLGWLVTHMAAIPHVTLSLVPLPAPLLVAYYIILLGGSWMHGGKGDDGRLDRSQIARLGLALSALLALVIWAQLFTGPAPAGRTLDLYVLDVGQGDALVARFPNGRIMVIDAGPSTGKSDRGRLTLAPFLKTLGCSTIDCLITTHADADHIGGLPYLLGRFGIGMMIEGPDTADSNLYRRVRETARERHVRTEPARQGAVLAGFDPVRVKLLGPVDGMADNNASVVMMVDYNDVEMLLTGDLEEEGERRLLAQGLIQDVEILKLGHHGSASSTSEALLEAARPEAALISVGRNNRYGHPAPAVLARLARRGAVAYRTDQLGSLWIRTDGHRIGIYRYNGP